MDRAFESPNLFLVVRVRTGRVYKVLCISIIVLGLKQSSGQLGMTYYL